MHESNKKKLLKEASVVLRYVSSSQVKPQLLKRYVRSIEYLHSGAPHPLLLKFYHVPFLLRFIEPIKKLKQDNDLDIKRRIYYGMKIYESSPESVNSFLILKKHSIFSIFLNIIYISIFESILLVLRFLYKALSK